MVYYFAVYISNTQHYSYRMVLLWTVLVFEIVFKNTFCTYDNVLVGNHTITVQLQKKLELNFVLS